MGYVIVFAIGVIVGIIIMSSMIVSGECQRKEDEIFKKNH